MIQSHFVLQDHNRSIQLQPERVAFYQQGEIIEAYNETNEVYYLLFYKYHFLTAVKATKLRRHSYIEAAFKKGMVFDAPHPLINLLLSSNQTYKMTNFPYVITKLKKHYNPQERAQILTFFESFIPKKQLFNEISSIFYEYRRNGQMFQGYRIIRILMNFAPKHSLIRQLSSDLQFNKYAVLYSENSDKILAKDLIFAEKTLYAQKDHDSSFQQLLTLLEKESRWMDLIGLYIGKLTATPKIDYYLPLLNLLKQNVNEQDTMYILEKLSYHLPTFLPLQQELFNHYVRALKMNEVFQMMNRYHFKLSKAQAKTLEDIVDDFNLEDFALEPEELKTLMKTIIHLFPEKAEKFLYNAVTLLLKTHEVPFIKEWIKSFEVEDLDFEVFEKIDTMQKLNDDLDYMQTLGELYYDFKQWEKAIECFSWEMELKPTDSKPLQWLARTYRKMGMTYEANAYQQLCINIQKHA